jgi:adenosylhomocysteine nucleosidase
MTVHILAAMREELQALSSLKHNLTVTGVGKVNAAIAASRLLTGLWCTQELSQILLVGTAAACDPDLEIGDVVISTDTLHHDVDVTSLGFAPGQIPFNRDWIWESDEHLRERAEDVCAELGIRHVTGRIITGDQFVCDPERVAALHKTFGAACIEMETAGLAQALAPREHLDDFSVPWLGIRVISDKADKSAPVDFNEFLPRASETLSRIVKGILLGE